MIAVVVRWSSSARKNGRIQHACKEAGSHHLPKESFYLGSRSAAEEKESVWYEQIFMELPLYDRCKRVNTIAEISGAADDVDTSKRSRISIFKHSAPP